MSHLFQQASLRGNRTRFPLRHSRPAVQTVLNLLHEGPLRPPLIMYELHLQVSFTQDSLELRRTLLKPDERARYGEKERSSKGRLNKGGGFQPARDFEIEIDLKRFWRTVNGFDLK